MTVHPTALIEKGAMLGTDIEVGPFTIIHSNVVIGEGSRIGSHCEIGVPTPLGDGTPLFIGKNSVIRSHSVFYESSSFGDKLTTGHRVTVRELTRAGDGLQIGTLSDLQGHIRVGEFVRLHSNVHIGQKSEIGDFVWLFPYVVLTNDPHPPSNVLRGVNVLDYAVIATMCTVLPGVTIGEGALIGACSCVTKDVGAGRIAVGNPAVDRGDVTGIKLQDGTGRPAYPWTSHFRRGYPEDIVQSWRTDD